MTTRTPPDILAVDDEDLVRWALVRSLAFLGYQADGMRTAGEAVYAMEIHPATLVLMDLSLAEDDIYKNGCDALTGIARSWPSTRVCLVTGWSMADLPPDCPPDLPLLCKPFGTSELGNRVRHLLASPPWRPT